MNEKILRLAVFIAAAALHLLVIFFFVFDTQRSVQIEDENARIMKLTDIDELPPPEPEIPRVEEIAESMIETDTPPIQEVVAAGSILESQEVYLPMHQLSTQPQFDPKAIEAAIVYPPIARRNGIEGRVILELFVDRTGTVQRITVLLEEPEGRGFGEAAVRALTGIKGVPATANGESVSCRYRYPIRFTLK